MTPAECHARYHGTLWRCHGISSSACAYRPRPRGPDCEGTESDRPAVVKSVVTPKLSQTASLIHVNYTANHKSRVPKITIQKFGFFLHGWIKLIKHGTIIFYSKNPQNVSTEIIFNTLFSTIIIRNVSWALHQHIRIISGVSCDTDCSYYAENSALTSQILLKHLLNWRTIILLHSWSNKCSQSKHLKAGVYVHFNVMVEYLIDNRPLNNKTWCESCCSVIGQRSWRRSPAEEDWQVVYIHILHCTSSSDGHVSSHSSGQYGRSLKSEHTRSTIRFSGSHILSVSFFNALKLKCCSSCGLVIAYMLRQMM